MLELNDVLVEGAENTVSMMAQEHQVTCLTGGSSTVRSQLLLAMMGLATVKSGYISIDGEPLEASNAKIFRRLMSYAPSKLEAEGKMTIYEPPTVQDVFSWKDNLDAAISNGLLEEEMKRTMAPRAKAQLLAVAVLRRRPILLVDQPDALSANYLHHLATDGQLVIVSSDVPTILGISDNVVEI